MTKDPFEQGLALRKEILGADYVERAIAGADRLGRPMQDLSTRYCWGEIWARPGLSRRDRSLLNLGMIAALNRPHEFKLHVKAARRNGMSEQEIAEALLQIAVYCGVPAGMDVARLASEALSESEIDEPPA